MHLKILSFVFIVALIPVNVHLQSTSYGTRYGSQTGQNAYQTGQGQSQGQGYQNGQTRLFLRSSYPQPQYQQGGGRPVGQGFQQYNKNGQLYRSQTNPNNVYQTNGQAQGQSQGVGQGGQFSRGSQVINGNAQNGNGMVNGQYMHPKYAQQSQAQGQAQAQSQVPGTVQEGQFRGWSKPNNQPASPLSFSTWDQAQNGPSQSINNGWNPTQPMNRRPAAMGNRQGNGFLRPGVGPRGRLRRPVTRRPWDVQRDEENLDGLEVNGYNGNGQGMGMQNGNGQGQPWTLRDQRKSRLEQPEECMNASGPVHCQPQIDNIAQMNSVLVSGTCGQEREQAYCIPPAIRATREDLYSGIRIPDAKCGKCKLKKQFSPSNFLTDEVGSLNEETCWLSNIVKSNDENVTITLNFEHRFEILYVSLLFCTPLPDSLVIEKSVDNGFTWAPFHIFSSQCRAVYGRTPRNAALRVPDHEALCVDPVVEMATKAGGVANGANGESANDKKRLSFTPLEGRSSSLTEDGPLLQEWVTASNIRIVLQRLYSPAALQLLEGTQRNATGALVGPTRSFENRGFIYAISDLSIGGRCKCNGHAKRCIPDAEGKLVCDCKHGTTGQDCERCRNFFNDAPWTRSTSTKPSRCLACKCNGHSRLCQFDKTLYINSNKQTGGRCLKCKHHTAGIHCDSCAPGYYRNHKYLITSPYACQPCNCHKMGTQSNYTNICNPITGQCFCKEGLTRLKCDMCLPGYKQSPSDERPCIKENVEVAMQDPPKPENCAVCPAGKTISPKEFCSADYAMQVYVTAKEALPSAPYFRFTAQVNHVFKNNRRATSPIQTGVTQGQWSPLQTNTPLSGSTIYIYVQGTDVQCDCPRMYADHQFLIVSRENPTPPELRSLGIGLGTYNAAGRYNVNMVGSGISRGYGDNSSTTIAQSMPVKELWLSSKSIVLSWQLEYSVRMRKLMQLKREGTCSQFASQMSGNGNGAAMMVRPTWNKYGNFPTTDDQDYINDQAA